MTHNPNPTDAQMKLAREYACQAVEVYGEGDAREHDAAVLRTLWNDHPAVQSALLAIQATEARAQVLVEAERERGWNGAIKTLDEWLVKAMNETVFAKETTIEHQEATRGAFRAARGAAASLLCRDETGFLVDAETPERIAAAINHSKYGGERER